MGEEKELKDCCKDPKNHKTQWQMNVFEDWEPIATYCICCLETIDEHATDKGGY